MARKRFKVLIQVVQTYEIVVSAASADVAVEEAEELQSTEIRERGKLRSVCTGYAEVIED
ncbi:MAG: hypothetical protein WC992_08880 [Acholeplasmataceae bacterium]